jgi:hypothetical protein
MDVGAPLSPQNRGGAAIWSPWAFWGDRAPLEIVYRDQQKLGSTPEEAIEAPRGLL